MGETTRQCDIRPIRNAPRQPLEGAAAMAGDVDQIPAWGVNTSVRRMMPNGLVAAIRTLIFRPMDEIAGSIEAGELRMEALSGLVDA